MYLGADHIQCGATINMCSQSVVSGTALQLAQPVITLENNVCVITPCPAQTVWVERQVTSRKCCSMVPVLPLRRHRHTSGQPAQSAQPLETRAGDTWPPSNVQSHVLHSALRTLRSFIMSLKTEGEAACIDKCLSPRISCQSVSIVCVMYRVSMSCIMYLCHVSGL